ncbi:MAG: NUDIX domain-containing protein [Blastocatellia bacterium]|nr:NUDIX domain-containing protein [Blastocatellia bacterium]
MKGIGKLLSFAVKLRNAYWRLREPTIVGVRAIVVDNNRVMLVKHTYLKGWYLPGGKVDRGETVYQAVAREVEEECALLVKRAKLVGIYSNVDQNRNDHIALFLVDAFQPGKASRFRDLEIAEASFFDIEKLPSGTTPATLRRINEFKNFVFDGEYW